MSEGRFSYGAVQMVPNFRQYLSSAFFSANYRLKISLYVKLKDLMSNSVDPDETAHYEPSHLDLR